MAILCKIKRYTRMNQYDIDLLNDNISFLQYQTEMSSILKELELINYNTIPEFERNCN